MAEIYQLPENGSNNGTNIPFSIPIGLGGFNNGFGNGFGSFNSIADLFGLAIIASMFGWGNGGFGGGFGNWGGGAGQLGFLSNQLNNDSGRELIMNAITSQGESARTAIQTLSTMLGQDFNLVNNAVNNVQNALQTLALQQAVSVPQIINAIQSGDASLLSAFQNCCCENRLAICQQTNTLQNDISAHDASVRLQLAQNEAADQLSVCQQTNTLLNAINAQTVAMNDQFCALKERELQNKIDAQGEMITQLRNQISNDQQTLQFNAAFRTLDDKIDAIAAKQPNTVPVQYPNLVAVNQTPYTGGWNGWNGWNGGGIVF